MIKFYLKHFFKNVSVNFKGVDRLTNSKFDMRVAMSVFQSFQSYQGFKCYTLSAFCVKLQLSPSTPTIRIGLPGIIYWTKIEE